MRQRLGNTLGLGCVLLASMLVASIHAERLVFQEVLITLFVVATSPVTTMLLMRAGIYRRRADTNKKAADQRPYLSRGVHALSLKSRTKKYFPRSCSFSIRSGHAVSSAGRAEYRARMGATAQRLRLVLRGCSLRIMQCM